MKPGDIIEWSGASRVESGTIVDKNGVLVCRMRNGKEFPIKDLETSRSATLHVLPMDGN